MDPGVRRDDTGGKLVMLEHMSDYAQSPYAGIGYFQQMQKRMGEATVADFMRLYAAPGWPTSKTALLTRCMVRPCVARRFRRIGGGGLASMYPASDWSVCFGPSWISARVRSH